MQRVPWFVIGDLYGRYYAAARGWVGRCRSDTDADTNANANADADTDADADADEEVEAREGSDLDEEGELIGSVGDDTVDAAGGCCRGGAGGRGGGLYKAHAEDRGVIL